MAKKSKKEKKEKLGVSTEAGAKIKGLLERGGSVYTDPKEFLDVALGRKTTTSVEEPKTTTKAPYLEPEKTTSESGSTSSGLEGIKVSRTTPKGGMSQEQLDKLREKQRYKNELEIAQMMAEGGRKVVSPEERMLQAEQLSETGAFEEVNPYLGQTSLTPLETPAANVPLIGKPAESIISSVLLNARMRGWLDNQLKEGAPGKELTSGEAQFPMPETPETLREAALREIRQKSYEEGISATETFGAFIEALPIVGGALSKWVKIGETPYANAEDVKNEILSFGEKSTNMQEKVRNGLKDPQEGLDYARKAEELIAQLEGRLKLLVQTSKVLREDADLVSGWESAIDDAKIRVDNLRQASAYARTAEMTGTGRIVPTDEQMFFELKDLYGKK